LRVFIDEGIAAKRSVEGGEETQDLSRAQGPWERENKRRAR